MTSDGNCCNDDGQKFVTNEASSSTATGDDERGRRRVSTGCHGLAGKPRQTRARARWLRVSMTAMFSLRSLVWKDIREDEDSNLTQLLIASAAGGRPVKSWVGLPTPSIGHSEITR